VKWYGMTILTIATFVSLSLYKWFGQHKNGFNLKIKNSKTKLGAS
jgi:hypothetical protein